MTNTVYLIQNQKMMEAGPKSISSRHSMPLKLPVPKKAGWGEGLDVPADVLVRIESVRASEHRLVLAAKDLSEQHPQEFEFVKQKIAEGKTGHARLLLNVSSRYPDELENAVLALHPDMGADDGRVRELNEKLAVGQEVNIADELDKLIPVPEPVRKPADERGKKPAEPGSVSAGGGGIKEDAGAGVVLPAEPAVREAPSLSVPQVAYADENSIHQNISRDFPAGFQDRARSAYVQFHEAGGRITEVQSRSMFHILGRVHSRYDNPEYMFRFFEHLLANPENAGERIGVFTDTERYEQAIDLIDSTLMYSKHGRDVVLSRRPDAIESAFKTILLSRPQDYLFLTGEASDKIKDAVFRVSRNIDDNLAFISHVIDSPECRETALDMERLINGNTVYDGLLEFASANGLEASRELKRQLFQNVFLRPPESFDKTTSTDASNLALGISGRRLSESVVLDKRFQEPFVQLLLARPEVLHNAGRQINPPPQLVGSGLQSLPRFIAAVDDMRDLPNTESYVTGLLTRMIEDPESAMLLSEPERLERALELVEDWRGYVKPLDILHHGFLCMDEQAQLRELGLIKRLRDDRGFVEQRAEPDRSAHAIRLKPSGGTSASPAGEHLTTFIHGIRVPRDLDDPEEDSQFAVLNSQFIRKLELDKVNRLPPHLKRIVNFLSNLSAPDENFATKEDQLLSRLKKHGSLGRIYSHESGRMWLEEDLTDLSADGIVDYSQSSGRVSLSGTVRKTGKTNKLSPLGEQHLVGVLDEKRYEGRKEKDLPVDAAILLALAHSEDYVAKRSGIVDRVFKDLGETVPKTRISLRIGHLERDMGLVCKRDPTGLRILLSPNVIHEVDEMNLPDVYRTKYLDEIDPLRRIRSMYQMVLSDARPPNEYFNPALSSEAVENIYYAVALITGGGDDKKARAKSDYVERRIRLAKTLSNMSLNLNHGSKRERIQDALPDMKSISVLQGLLTDMVRASIVERVAHGYYRINPSYWVNTSPGPSEVAYPDRADYKTMNANIDENGLRQALVKSPKFKTTYKKQQALMVLGLMSNESTIIPYCAKSRDILALRRLFGEEVTENQNDADIEALRKPGDEVFGSLIDQFKPAGTTDTFNKISDQYTVG